MTRKRFIKLMMGRGSCRYRAEYIASLAVSPIGAGSYQKQWERVLEGDEISRAIYEGYEGVKKMLAEYGLDLEAIC